MKSGIFFLFVFSSTLYGQILPVKYAFVLSRFYYCHQLSVSKAIGNNTFDYNINIHQNHLSAHFSTPIYQLKGRFWALAPQDFISPSVALNRKLYQWKDSSQCSFFVNAAFRTLKRRYDYLEHYLLVDTPKPGVIEYYSIRTDHTIFTKRFYLPELSIGFNLTLNINKKINLVQQLAIGYLLFLTREDYKSIKHSKVIEDDIRMGGFNYFYSIGLRYNYNLK